MIVGGYTLDLYCDNGLNCSYAKATFYGASGEKCRSKARKEGWRVAVSKNHVLCPLCNGKHRPKATRQEIDQAP